MLQNGCNTTLSPIGDTSLPVLAWYIGLGINISYLSIYSLETFISDFFSLTCFSLGISESTQTRVFSIYGFLVKPYKPYKPKYANLQFKKQKVTIKTLK